MQELDFYLTQADTAVEISSIKSVRFPDERLDTVSRVIVELLLPYFVEKERPCPRILIREANEPTVGVSLNDYLGKADSQIVEMRVEQGTFTLPSNEEAKDFQVRVFKFYAPRLAKSKVNLVARRREVTDNPLQAYTPEFAEEFYEAGSDEDLSKGRK